MHGSPGLARMSVLASFLLCAAGCASVNYQRVHEDSSDGLGIRYYDTSPYLIVHSNPDGSLNVRLEHLPDPHKLMAVKPSATAAKVDTTLTFERGALKSASSTLDAGALPRALLKAVETVAKAALAESLDGEANPPTYEVPGPRIYKVLVQGDSVHLIGSADTGHFEISLIEVKTAAKKSGGKPSSAEGGDRDGS